MLKYLAVYKEFLSTCFAEASSYRAHFILLILMDNIFYLTALFSVDFIYDHVATIGAWNHSQFIFFTAFLLAVDHLHMTFVSENFWNFSYEIRTGTLDFRLLMPINPIFLVFFRLIRAGTMPNFIIPWSVMIYYGTQIGITTVGWMSLPLLLVFALILLVSLEILLSMTMFWTIESFGINFLRMQFQSLARWPDFVYRSQARKLFTFVLPLLVIGSGPVYFVFDQSKNFLLFYGLISLPIIWLAIWFFWRLGLRGYESASS